MHVHQWLFCSIYADTIQYLVAGKNDLQYMNYSELQ